MTMVERLCAVSRILPPSAQAELLDFAEFLQQRNRAGPLADLLPLSLPLLALAGGLEDTASFAGSPLDMQESLRREWD